VILLADQPDDRLVTAPAWVIRLLGREGIGLAFAWGFAEGTLFFVVPDVLISLAALCGGRRALPHVAAAVAGALLAGAVMFAWSAADYAAASAAVQSVPFVPERMVAQVIQGLETEQAVALFRGSVTGIPYKLFAVEAPGRLPLSLFLAATVLARAARFLLVWSVFTILGAWVRRRHPGNWSRLAWLHAALWIPFYVIYWSVV
jgi:membrane protein YqaA with SNARE-associated domain